MSFNFRKIYATLGLPLNDGAGLLVLYDRRSGRERRKITATADHLLKLFSELPAIDPELLKSFVK